MCGICGVFHFATESPVEEHLLVAMRDTLRHRGPDESGLYRNGRVGLGSRRLSIIDLSAGQQPMSNEDGTVWIVYNGELYNFRELRQELEQRGHEFRTHCDTESIIHLYEELGSRCVDRLRGMFAFAIWDARKNSVFLARDHFGIKPLYYYLDSERLVFGSELKAILRDPTIPRRLDLDALADYLTYQYIPAPRTIYQGIRKLPAAHTLLIESGRVALDCYWQLRFREEPAWSDREYVARLREMIQEAVRSHLISDVSLGVLLSGGMDSSAVVALMSQVADQPIRTFSIGFNEHGFDELHYARLVARHFKTDHHEEIVTPDAVGLLPDLVQIYDEPFADPSAIPTFYVSRLARQSVAVCLSGDGGDETFAGYDHYPMVLRQMRRYRVSDRLPVSVRQRVFSTLAQAIPEGVKGHFLARQMSLTLPQRSGEIIGYFNGPALRRLLSPDRWAALDRHEEYAHLCDSDREVQGLPELTRLQYVDMQNFMGQGILTKVDRASMANSLEVRVPLLDLALQEFMATVPANLKLHNGERKYILKRAMEDLLPAEILNRSKMGFGIPLDAWFRKPLYDLSHDLLLDQRARQRGLFCPAEVERLLSDHNSGRKNLGRQIWALVVFEMWCRRNWDTTE